HELGLPLGDSSLLPSLWVNRAARRTFKVALTGDGGDELFLGYDRHRALGLLGILGRLPAPLRRTLAHHVSPGRSPPLKYQPFKAKSRGQILRPLLSISSCADGPSPWPASPWHLLHPSSK
ncbi:MAG: hypothetical protein IIB38_06550, partial [Candidatus Hydrogenedentes bacterium]|nr:hypothetical protein [Candidatus Hydrogenedentota bacterium]